MSENATGTRDAAVAPAAAACARCGGRPRPGDGVVIGDHAYCGSCYEGLLQERAEAGEARATRVNYPMALVGALLGGAVGTAIWWGCAALTDIAVDLAAVVIGFCVGGGATRLAGGGRSRGLQALSAGVALVCFLAATYVVNAAFGPAALAGRGIPMLPPHPSVFWEVVTVSFGLVDFALLAVVLWEAWELPAPQRPVIRDIR